MKRHQVAAILYTLRDFCKTAEDLETTLGKVREIGYQAVQVSGIGPIEPQVVRELLDRADLVCCATHENANEIRANPAKLVEKMKILGCDITAYPYPAGVEFDSEESVSKLIADLNAAGKVFRDNGIRLCYHNHAHEFYRVGKETVLDRIYAGTNPQSLQAELDVFWVQAGGADPVDWIRRMHNRLPALHMKDYGVKADGSRYFAEIGHGNLNFPAIVSAAEAAGCQWFIVEQDVCPGDPFDSLRMSWDYISSHLCED